MSLKVGLGPQQHVCKEVKSEDVCHYIKAPYEMSEEEKETCSDGQKAEFLLLLLIQ